MSGRVHTSTYKKPYHNPQYLAFQSQHAPHVMSHIFKAESFRHMVNCSNDNDYYRCVADLAGALRKRGYPSEHLQVLPYDREAREVQLLRLQQRQRVAKQQTIKDLVVFRCAYSNLLKHVRIRREFQTLLRELRFDLGEEFMADSRFIIANTIEHSSFLRCYPQSRVDLGAPPSA